MTEPKWRPQRALMCAGICREMHISRKCTCCTPASRILSCNTQPLKDNCMARLRWVKPPPLRLCGRGPLPPPTGALGDPLILNNCTCLPARNLAICTVTNHLQRLPTATYTVSLPLAQHNPALIHPPHHQPPLASHVHNHSRLLCAAHWLHVQ
jgi:hypothetical protein